VQLIREDKPTWRQVPESVRRETDRILGSRVTRAVRAYGGYGPSATFALNLDNGARAFFKGVYPLPEGSAVKWSLEEEERVYRDLGEWINPWAPAYLGSIRSEGWHALLIEAVEGTKVPPWTTQLARSATRSYAEFHASTLGQQLPAWIDDCRHADFSGYWREISSNDAAVDLLAGLAGPRRGEARQWLSAHMREFADHETRLAEPTEPYALLHFDTRSDNIRVARGLLRMFDWPFACVGPPEFDVAAFAQSIASEGGPSCESTVGSYSEVLSVRSDVLSACVVGISGYFADRAPRPDPPGLPRLRSVQRRQLKASLAWAARLLRLPDPDWLTGVAD
jgi:hypothetical protein